MITDLDADAFFAAHEAAPDLDPELLRMAIDVYLGRMHLHVRRIHDERDLTPAEVLGAFAPRTVEF